MRRDITNILHVVPLFEPKAAVTDNTAIVSAIIDTRGYNGCMLSWVTGTNADTDATVTCLVEDGDAANLSDNAAVDDKYLNGLETVASYTFADDVECRKIGYVGPKRYVRVTLTPANNTGNVFVAGIAVLGEPAVSPTPNPPQ